MFGAVVLVVHRQPNWKPGAVPNALPYALVAYSSLVVFIATVLKGRVGREPDRQRRGPLLIMGWAVGESAALFGVMIFYVTDQAQWYGLGLLAMVSALAILSPGAALATAGSLDAPG
jgi:hypothetical protein